MQEYEQLKVHSNEDDDTEDYTDEEDACVGTEHVGYDFGTETATESGENKLHVQMNKVIKDMKEDKNLARNTYNKFCEKIGTMDNHNVLQETVRRTTRKQAWKNFKLLEEEDYHYNSTFAMFIFESLGISMETVKDNVQRQELWLKFKKYVSEGMQAARSSATQAIKKQFIGKLRHLLVKYFVSTLKFTKLLPLQTTTALTESNQLPELADFEKGRHNKEVYMLFCSSFLPGVTGSGAFKNACCTMKLSDYCSKSDEAMTFLILANNWEPWKTMIQAKRDQGATGAKRLEECGVKQKYFKETKGRGHSWSNDGKLYFNESYDRISNDREDNGEIFDNEFLEYMKKESNEGKRLEKLQTKQSKPDCEKIVIRNDYVPKADWSKRISSTNLFSTNSEFGESMSALKKQRYECDEHSIATEQAQKLGAINVMMM
jgi:hypothetical protein